MRSLILAVMLLPLPAWAAAPESASPVPGAAPVSPEIASALAGLGTGVRIYTAKAHPLGRLDQIAAPEVEVAITSPGLARALGEALRAGGVKLRGGAYGVTRLIGPNQFAAAFRPPSKLRLLVVAAHQAAPGPAPTSFGPVVGAALADSARLRAFPRLEAQISERRARPGQRLLVVKIDRDFGAGLGTISFLFGSGYILEPDFRPLVVSSTGGRKHPLVGTHADGPRLELVYEIPRGVRGLALVEGDARWPLDQFLGNAQATN